MMKQWYQELFENYGVKYEQESYIHGTTGECDFIETEIAHDKKVRILDIGCGTGRHSIELSKRGYSVTAVDLSDSLLKQAKLKASKQNVQVDFRKCDARNLPFQGEFGLAIMLCEAAFPLMETDEMNFQILKNAANALGLAGKLIITTLNALFPLYHNLADFYNCHAEDNMKIEHHSFDLMTFRDHNTVHVEDDSGKKKKLLCNERYYAPAEMTWLLNSLNFRTVDIFGAKLGAFSRNDKLSTEDYEMLVIAKK